MNDTPSLTESQSKIMREFDPSSLPRRHCRQRQDATDAPSSTTTTTCDVVPVDRPTAMTTTRRRTTARRRARGAASASGIIAAMALATTFVVLFLPSSPPPSSSSSSSSSCRSSFAAAADVVVVGPPATDAKAANDGDGGGGGTVFRVFQALPREPSSMTPDEVESMRRTLRSTREMIFASPKRAGGGDGGGSDGAGPQLALDVYSPAERREYLVRRGNRCHPRGGGGGGGGGGGELRSSDVDGDTEGLQWYDVLSRYDSLMSVAASSSSSATKDAACSPSEGGRDPACARPLPPGAASGLERAAIELFKFCLLYNGDGHAYWGWDEQLLLPFGDVVSMDVNYGVVFGTVGNGGGRGSERAVDSGNDSGEAAAISDKAVVAGHYVHESFLSISPHAPATSALSSMIRLILETSDDVLAATPLLLPRELHRLIVAEQATNGDDVGNGGGGGDAVVGGRVVGGSGDGEKGNGGAAWTLLRNACVQLAEDGGGRPEASASSPASSGSSSARGLDALTQRTVPSCPLSDGGYCCLAFFTDNRTDNGKDDVDQGRSMPVMALRHPVGGWTYGGDGAGRAESRVDDGKMMPYALVHGDADVAAVKNAAQSSAPLGLGGVPEADLRYISTVRLVSNNTAGVRPGEATNFPTHPADAPNFFDILFENDCLPYRVPCHRCLKDVANERPAPGEPALTQRNACTICKLECPCYCDILCKVRPPPKPITRTYSVRLPRYRKDPERLVPKIIHQTWFEPVTKDKYPNMSRLIESWKKSGWEYYFYDDETAGEFLGSHFPPEIREAYESITPGAFKADLFRYCVLLIRGGVYADMDVLLQTNLDEAIANDIGFMTPLDEPGDQVGHRSCLWNGLIASAPGHPFLARTIEIVVNNIRNRFTAVDYDDMLCPNPILSIVHTVDTLFTCGPCILGAGINNLLERHMQTEFEIGDVDIWRSQQSQAAAVRPDDPRLLIPGRTIILQQNKNDMGAHRFTWADRHLIVAATDMPDYDDRPPSKEHYSKTHEKAGVYGLRKLYTDTKRANEEIRIVVEKL